MGDKYLSSLWYLLYGTVSYLWFSYVVRTYVGVLRVSFILVEHSGVHKGIIFKFRLLN